MSLQIILQGEESKADSTIKQIVQLAMPAPRTLDSTPSATTALNLLPNHGDWGHVAGIFYFNLAGKVYSFTGTLIV